jgi:hypothetical protein
MCNVEKPLTVKVTNKFRNPAGLTVPDEYTS